MANLANIFLLNKLQNATNPTPTRHKEESMRLKIEIENKESALAELEEIIRELESDYYE